LYENKISGGPLSVESQRVFADLRFLLERFPCLRPARASNLISVSYPLSPSLTFSYDAMSRLSQMVDGIGTTAFGYTPAGQLASETGPWASDTVSYTYANQLRQTLNLLQPNASPWAQSYGYDAVNRLQTVTSQAGLFQYAYSPGLAGASSSALVRQILLPNGAVISNSFDGNARMTSTYLVNSGRTVLDSSAYTYNVGNQRTQVERTGENYANYTYDKIGQVIGDQAYESAVGNAARLNEQLGYAFDAAGNLNYRTNNALIANFQVNTLNELTANTNGGTLTVMGTATSTNLGVTVNGTAASTYSDATFAAPNMPLTTSYTAVAHDGYGRWATNMVSVNLANNISYQYDANGNLTNDGLRNFQYDDENELIQVSVPGQWLSQFQYDGKMRRRIRTEYSWQGSWVQTNVVYYIYDGNLVIQERDANNLPTVTYTRGKDLSGSLEGAGGIGGLLARTSQADADAAMGGTTFYHADGNGNITALINSSNTIVAKYLYDGFGDLLSKSGPLADANLYRFSSKEWHENSGLNYYLYRYYDPNLQRWPNRDPLSDLGFEAFTPIPFHLRRFIPFGEISQGPDLYEFVGNNPENKFDPLGLGFGGVWHPNQCPLRPGPCEVNCAARAAIEGSACALLGNPIIIGFCEAAVAIAWGACSADCK
jgi:RHS repeat-associated protein